MSELPPVYVVAWEIRWVFHEGKLCAVTKTVKSTIKRTETTKPPIMRERGKIEIYRSHFKIVLARPKNLRDQLILEGPILQALRPGEVSSLRAEWLDFETGDMQILDSKKQEMFTRPMDPQWAHTSEAYMIENHITSGILIQPLPNAHHTGHKKGARTRGEGLSVCQIERVWTEYFSECGFPIKSPREGRAYWACYEHYVRGMPEGYIQWFLRHDDPQSTKHYLFSRIVDYESMKKLFYQGRMSPVPDACVLMDHCDLSEFGCRCRMFQGKKIEMVEAWQK